MKKTRLCAVLLAAILLLALLTACGETSTDLTISVVNRSGQEVSEIYITTTSSDSWGMTRIETPMADQDTVQIQLGSFTEQELSEGFNFLIYDADGMQTYDTALSEQVFTLNNGDYVVLLPVDSEVSLDITPTYNATNYDTLDAPVEEPEPVDEEPVDLDYEDEEPLPDISAFVGCWKSEDLPIYVVINEEFEWVAINLYSQQAGPGMVIAEGDGISLEVEDGSVLASLTVNDPGVLIDEEGYTLVSSDYIMLLPTPEDELNQTASFPGSFSNVTIDYPLQMSVHEHPNVSNALSFNAVMEEGTDDYYTNVMIAFQPISGFDPYMEQGAGTAKAYMGKMLSDFMNSMYGDKLIKSFGSDFVDHGDYYSLTGYMWFDGSIFSDGPSQPVRGCMEVRYYGPTGYALVATTIALESRIRNYFDICNHMLETLSYTAGWSTSPKPVPAKPAASYSGDTGDYGTPYYWYDEDGDVWYWNGYKNEFIGFGDSYYIDDDGQYYESNDAGWDYDDGYDWDYEYDDDYDPWSDPGDYADPDYYGEEGWGDYFE